MNIELPDPAVVAIMQSKTPAERLQSAFAANRTLRLLISGRLMTDHPDWKPEQVKEELARRMIRGTA